MFTDDLGLLIRADARFLSFSPLYYCLVLGFINNISLITILDHIEQFDSELVVIM